MSEMLRGKKSTNLGFCTLQIILQKWEGSGPVVKTPLSNEGGVDSVPRCGIKIPHATGWGQRKRKKWRRKKNSQRKQGIYHQ